MKNSINYPIFAYNFCFSTTTPRVCPMLPSSMNSIDEYDIAQPSTEIPK